MENSIYAALTRQSGLLNELQVIANNIANASTTGFKSETVMFSEHISDVGTDQASLSMAEAKVRNTDFSQGTLTKTGGTFDLAIEGDGFFLVQTPGGERLTRAGAFAPNENGDLVTMDGNPVLDAGGAPVFIPQGLGTIGIAADGTISAQGRPIGQIGIVSPTDPDGLTREGGLLFDAPDGFVPTENGRVVQGFVENANVNPISEIGRMIEVQRAYEMGQNFLKNEDDRIRAMIRAMGR